MNPLLTVQDLKTYFFTPRGTVRVLDGLKLAVHKGEILGLVGESGSGKSVTAYSIMRLLPPEGRTVGGSVLFDGRDLLALSEDEMERVRGYQISMIFQNPRESLNPVMKVGKQLQLVHKLHHGMNPQQSYTASVELLKLLQLPDPLAVMNAYPHQLSGGMCQRVLIALAIASRPKLLIADEATTALDVTIQLEIIQLLKRLRDTLGLAEIIITHNLGVIAELCDTVAVMYSGEIVEVAPVKEIFENAKHPYTEGLLKSRPRLGAERVPDPIAGEVPDLSNPPSGCRFHPRCPHAFSRCPREAPPPFVLEANHQVSCFLYDGAQ